MHYEEYVHTHLSEKVLDSIHIERQGEAQCLVQRVTLYCTDQIRGIQLENTHAETGTDREILTVSLIFILIVITATNKELLIVIILQD